MANTMFIVLGIYIFSIHTGSAQESCSKYSSFYSSKTYKYCYNGCCYYGSSSPCCDSYYGYSSYYDYWNAYYTLSAGAIAGIVIGCLVGISIFVTIIICICNTQRRNTQYGGQVITSTQPTISYVGTNAGQPYTQPYIGNVNGGFTMGPTVPAYNKENYSAPPPSYNTVVNSPTMDINQSAPYPTQAYSTPATTNYSSLSPNSDSNEHYYSQITENPSPSAPPT